ncbi:MAG: amidohydrolase family protein [Chloroflexi bacterium]|nr:amidohydrolase family protein [Chloroflexota bacterium]
MSPGLVDLQVNGFAGVDLNSPALTPDDVLAVVRALARHGVTRFLPTVITAPYERMHETISVIARARRIHREVAGAAVGVHLEGPYISGRDGPRGAHDPRWVRAPDKTEFAALAAAAEGATIMVTVAPELKGALQLIRTGRAAGVVMAIGHTAADVDVVTAATEAGASLSTHLGNATEQLLPRHANVINAQLAEDRLCATFIADGHHVPPHVLRTYLRAKGISRSILVSDATAAAAAPPGRYRLGELELTVGEDRIVRHPHRESFAGSALSLDDAVSNAARWCAIELPDAIDMASLHPLRALGMGLAQWSPDASDVDLVVASLSAGRFRPIAAFRGRPSIGS